MVSVIFGKYDLFDFFGLAYTWVEWLEYNIRRALGECMDEPEKEMGVIEVKNTINRIKHLYYNERDIKAALRRMG